VAFWASPPPDSGKSCPTEPGGSANAASPLPGEGVRTVAELKGDKWIINGRKKWISSATGWDRKGADVL